ncbi:MAG: tRNA pseudouridine(38-40) synthase TruA [Cytophagales bacterium]|nr:tRNA pseudouridine(38-40) synthase TruA [Cytophagales bacterium]
MRLFCGVRYFLDIHYKGTDYSGWQIQTNANTIQAEINSALSTLLKSSIETLGSGRTDAGVHAHQQIAHFDTDEILELEEFVYKLNSLLPKDIAIRNVKKVKPDAHARFDANSRSYRYFIHSRKEPFVANSSYFFHQKLDVEIINTAIDVLKNQKDFESFSKVHTEVNNFNCDIFDASWELTANGYVFFIRANRFLRGMVRALVGTLLDVGTKRTTIDRLKEILESKTRSEAGRSVSPDGLYLDSVNYSEDIYL